MESPPPSTPLRSNRTKSASKTNEHSLDLVSYSPKNSLSPKPKTPLSLHELMLLSPSSARRSKNRIIDMTDEALEPRRRCKNRNSNVGSPRNSRRLRRRIEQEIREDKDKDLINGDDVIIAHNKPKKRRNSGRSKKEKSNSCHPISSPKGNDCCNLDRIGYVVNDLIMWNDVAKSTLWFGFGSICFLSSCFTTGVSFSMFSLISQLGLLLLGVSFFSNSIAQRNGVEAKTEVKLKEEDILRAARVVLPATNFVLSKTRKLFSGEPSMTLKVAPLLVIGAEYGHLITLKRFFALGFFISFTGPKLYSLYSEQINKKVEYMKNWVIEAWGACSHKKIVAASAITAFWNLTSIKTRVFAAFIGLVILRYHRQHMQVKIEEHKSQQKEKTLALIE